MIIDDQLLNSNISNMKSNMTEGGENGNNKKRKRITPTILN
jgi:hypothetical protein